MQPFRGLLFLVVVGTTIWLFLNYPPEIVRNLHSGSDGGATAFDQRLKSRFPVGTPMKTIEAELVRQGFEAGPLRDSRGIEKDGRYFDLKRPRFFCTLRWRVRARGSERLEDITGLYGRICL